MTFWVIMNNLGYWYLYLDTIFIMILIIVSISKTNSLNMLKNTYLFIITYYNLYKKTIRSING